MNIKIYKKEVHGTQCEFVKFGRYPQTAKGGSATKIEWRVLDKSAGGLLLITEKIIDCVGYFADDEDGGDIGKFLQRFYNTAFSEAERAAICGKPFLLSMHGAKKHFDPDKRSVDANLCRTAAGTNYAVATKNLHSYFEEEHWWDSQLDFTKGNSKWWLNDLLHNGRARAYVHIDGGIMDDLGAPSNGNSDGIGVRPCITINTSSSNSNKNPRRQARREEEIK